MEAINNTATVAITSSNLLEILRQHRQVLTEDGELLTVLSVMNFHAGLRREEEVRNTNPGSMTTKVYVMTLEKGPLICNVSKNLRGEGLILTHLQKVENLEAFLRQISREVDRSEEGNAFLLSAWSMV